MYIPITAEKQILTTLKKNKIACLNNNLLNLDDNLLALLHSLFENLDKLCNKNTINSFIINNNISAILLGLWAEKIDKKHNDNKIVFDLFSNYSYTMDFYKRVNLLSNTKHIHTLNNTDTNNIINSILTWQKLASLYLNKLTINILDKESYTTFFDDLEPNWLLRCIQYPEISSKDIIRLNEHVDDDFLTLVISNSFSGLQVRDEQNIWHDIDAESNVLLLGGRCLEYCTNNEYKAAPHRVVGGNNYNQERFVINFNIGPKFTHTEINNIYKKITKDKYFYTKK